ncbi:MAG: branched-chain amino acid ABC transporter permease [Firmicutes bacterium]|nr:branched-chain amino acid ABC transporter permease [Bacillota bacterium]
MAKNRIKNNHGISSKLSTPIMLSVILVLVGYFIWWLNIPFVQDIYTSAAITLVMVLGFQIFNGNSGILSWSYVGFVGIGAFSSAIFSMTPQMKSMQMPEMYPFLVNIHVPFVVALILGAIVAAIIAAVVAWPMMKISDDAGAITQFALLIVIHVILAQWSKVTNGPRTFTLGGQTLTTIWVAMISGVVVLFIAYFFKESSLGLKLRATRDDRYAACSSGIDMVKTRYLSYIFSAAIGGFAGGLYSHYILSINASAFYMTLLFNLLSMAVIGGKMSVSGAFFGTILLTLARQGLRQIEPVLTNMGVNASGSTEIIVAVLMIVFLVFRANGIMDRYELSPSSLKSLFSRKKKAEKKSA